MRELIKKILYEQDIPDENVVLGSKSPDQETWGKMSSEERHAAEEMPYKHRQIDKSLFFKIVKYLVEAYPKEWFVNKMREEEEEPVSEKLDELNDIFKLFGQTVQTLGYFTSDSLAAKIFYAAHDNFDSIKQGNFKQFDDLNLRSLKKFEVDCNESIREMISYTWTVDLEAYTKDDAFGEVAYNDDGFYSWWEWDNKPGFDKEQYDSDSEGMEIDDVREVTDEGKAVKSLGEHKIIKEVSDSGLASGLKNILKKWKASRTENRWYDEIEDLLKKERVNENKKPNKLIEVENVTHDNSDSSQQPAIEVFNSNEWTFMEKLVTDGINNYAEGLYRAADGNFSGINNVQDLAKLYGLTPHDSNDGISRLHLIAKYITDTLKTDSNYTNQLIDGEEGDYGGNPLVLLKKGSLHQWGEYEIYGEMYETTWVKSNINAMVEGFGPNDAAFKFAEDVYAYDPEISVDESYTDYEADRELEEITITSAEDLNSGVEYTGTIKWHKGYSPSGALLGRHVQLDEEQDTQLTIGDDDGTQRLRIVFTQMKTIEGWDTYIEEVMRSKKRLNDSRVQEPLMSTLKYIGYAGEVYNLASSAMDVTYWFASAFMLNGGYDRDFKEGEIRLIELPVYKMEGQYTEEQYVFKTGWGDIVGVTSEDEAINYFEGDIDAYIEDSEEDDRDYGDSFDIANVVVQDTTYIKFKPEWVGL